MYSLPQDSVMICPTLCSNYLLRWGSFGQTLYATNNFLADQLINPAKWLQKCVQ